MERVGVAISREPDRVRARELAERGTILRAVVGSQVHGLANAGTDDRDEMGVCVEPPEYVLGLRPFEHWVMRTQPEGVPSGPGDLDLTIYGLRKFARLAMKGSPTVLLILFAPDEHVLVRTPLGDELRALAPAFVARRTGRAFLGYLDRQRRGLLGERHATRTREVAGGYDTKYAMHAVRIGLQGIELLETGRITLPVPGPDRGRLMQVRRGELPLDDVLVRLHDVTLRLERIVAAAQVPPEPDRARADEFLVEDG